VYIPEGKRFDYQNDSIMNKEKDTIHVYLYLYHIYIIIIIIEKKKRRDLDVTKKVNIIYCLMK
jgi:hypothetical protein